MSLRRRLRTAWRMLRPAEDLPALIEIPLECCVHYCGFHYGASEYHPYETYQIGIERGIEIVSLRRQFIDFLRFYRPRHAGEALGISLSRPYPLWQYPWLDQPATTCEKEGWRETPGECPDLLTHFCEKGIPSVRIDEEFMWLERALATIAEHGYRPKQYGAAEFMQLTDRHGESAYLLMDGNHRAGALVALGASRTIAARRRHWIREEECRNWPGVRNGGMREQDALLLFRAYFGGNSLWKRSEHPAKILAPAGWCNLYLPELSGHVH